MGIAIQVLKDADNVDHAPFMEFCQWARVFDSDIFFAHHYSWADSQSDIMDLGSLHDELEEYFQSVADGIAEAFDPPPPDIRAWLKTQVDAGHCLAWVSW